jgi:hypothetical protein
VDTGYLRWVLRSCENAPPRLRQAIWEELDRRRDEAEAEAERRREEPELAAAHFKDILDGWYRGLVLKYHPDRGGSHEAMVAINDAHERLRPWWSDRRE